MSALNVLRQAQDDKTSTAVLSEINITPFTDVLLVLLIIFMILASLAIPPGFERQFAPCACSARSKDVPPRIAVVVTQRGRILVAGAATSVAALYSRFARMHARAPKATIQLFAGAKAPYGAIVRVLDAAKAGGVPDVSFVTE